MNPVLIVVFALAGWILFLYYMVKREEPLRRQVAMVEEEVQRLREEQKVSPSRERSDLIAQRERDVQALLDRSFMHRFGLSLMGPFLMVKTRRGRELIDRLSRAPRFWSVFGDASIGVVLATMGVMTGLLIWTATLVQRIPADRAPTPQTVIGLPGINPFIPVGYGIFALAVAIVVHEFSHGILARLAKVKLQSLGILLLIVPMGAFVEPDEDELKKVDKRSRGRMFAAGPAVNILVATITALLFSLVLMPAVTPVSAGAGILSVDAYPAQGNLTAGMVITAFDGRPVNTPEDFRANIRNATAGQGVVLTVMQKGRGSKDIPLVLGDLFGRTGVDSDRGKAYLGVTLATTSTDIYNPFAAKDFGGLFRASLGFIFLPIARQSPVQGAELEFYNVNGLWASAPDLFWLVANGVYWLFWINLMLGMTNALPAIPLDGGYLFKDILDGLLKRVRGDMKSEVRERVARNLSYIIALFILSLILWQMIGPRLPLG